MDFGRVDRVEELDRMRFELPALESRSIQLLGSLKPQDDLPSPSRVYVGCPLWGQKEWVGKVYPAKTSSKDFLKYYSKQFNSIELNTSFYRIPDSKTIQSWRQTVPTGFKFCPKFYQEITHQQSLVSVYELTQKFCEAVLSFEEALGVPFLQLPPHFDFSQLPVLWRFMERIPKKMPLAIEFRHPSWFYQKGLNPQTYDLLRERRASCVITDTGGRRDVLHGSITTNSVFIRFLGNLLHPTDYTRLDEWVVRIGEWLEAGLKEVYFFVHQPNDQFAPETVSYLIEKLNQKLNLGIKNWVPVVPEEQIELFG